MSYEINMQDKDVANRFNVVNWRNVEENSRTILGDVPNEDRFVDTVIEYEGKLYQIDAVYSGFSDARQPTMDGDKVLRISGLGNNTLEVLYHENFGTEEREEESGIIERIMDFINFGWLKPSSA